MEYKRITKNILCKQQKLYLNKIRVDYITSFSQKSMLKIIYFNVSKFFQKL